MRKDKITGIVLADIHFGVIDAVKLYKELSGIVTEFLRSKESLDVIFIAGDFFDHILYLNEAHAKYASMFMDDLLREAKRLGAKMRLIYGTESHECDQYSIFTSKFLNSPIDVRVIKTVEEEELFDNYDVLYLPEEYIYNKHDYYSKYLTGENYYRLIIGHGVIQELMSTVSFHIKKATKTSKRAKVPVFTSEELMDSCGAHIYFGHYHVNSEIGGINSSISYVGSFTRWQFGEERSKGFYYFEDHWGNDFESEFIENTLADTYTTITYGYDNPAFSSDNNLTDELSKIEKLDSQYDHLRVLFNLPEDYQNAEATATMIRDRFKNNKSIKVDITNGYVDKSKKINKEYLNESLKKYGMIFDKNLPVEEKAHQFIQKKFEQNIPADKIKWHMTVQDIMREVDD